MADSLRGERIGPAAKRLDPTPLTNGAINETLRHTLDISQGSVATQFRCGGIFSDSIITNFRLILTVK